MKQVTSEKIRRLRNLSGAGIMECRQALQSTEGDITKALEKLEELVRTAAGHREDRETKEGRVFYSIDRSAVHAVTLLCETDFAAANSLFTETGNRCLAVLREKQCDFATLTELVADDILRAKSRIKENMRLKSADWAVTREGESLAWYVHEGDRIVSALFYRTPPDEICANGTFRQLINDIALQIAAEAPRFTARTDIPGEYLHNLEKTLYAESAEHDKPERVRERIVRGRLEKRIRQETLLEQPFIRDGSRTVGEVVSETEDILGTKLVITRLLYQSVL